MFKPKAYKSMLAASVLTAVMGTGSVFAAEVQVGYTPDLNNTTTTSAATTMMLLLHKQFTMLMQLHLQQRKMKLMQLS